MKRLILAAAMTFGVGTVCLADGQYWVSGNRATNKCDIVTQPSVIYRYGGGNFWSGPVPTSPRDAKLARPPSAPARRTTRPTRIGDQCRALPRAPEVHPAPEWHGDANLRLQCSLTSSRAFNARACRRRSAPRFRLGDFV